MKSTVYNILLTLAMLAPAAAGAQTTINPFGVGAAGATMSRTADRVNIGMTLRLDSLDVDSRRAVVLTPRVTNGTETVSLPSVAVYGRNRYYYYLRHNGTDMLTGPGETVLRAASAPDSLPYSAATAYSPWMEGASLELLRQDYGCCGDILAEGLLPLISDFCTVYNPAFVYLRPTAEREKRRDISGSAYVNFPVNRTEIFPDYLDNTAELAKITASIDSIKGDADITIEKLSLKGYASPEGSYANNTRLASGRTAALKAYVERMYNFADGVIATDYEPENWEGLRQYVSASAIADKEGIIRIIDSQLPPDEREARLRAAYPADYDFLLKTCYPRLRRTDYLIAYVIRTYSDPVEIRRVMADNPSKLSLDEFYIAAESMQPGSDEYDETFVTAVRMYPADPAANLNAANSAMKRGDMTSAATYLERAGNSPQAAYARAVYAAINGDYATALTLMRQAKDGGVKEAEEEIRKIERVKR